MSHKKWNNGPNRKLTACSARYSLSFATFCVPTRYQLDVIDIAGSGGVHLVGGSSVGVGSRILMKPKIRIKTGFQKNFRRKMGNLNPKIRF